MLHHSTIKIVPIVSSCHLCSINSQFSIYPSNPLFPFFCVLLLCPYSPGKRGIYHSTIKIVPTMSSCHLRSINSQFIPQIPFFPFSAFYYCVPTRQANEDVCHSTIKIVPIVSSCHLRSNNSRFSIYPTNPLFPFFCVQSLCPYSPGKRRRLPLHYQDRAHRVILSSAFYQ